MTEPRWITREMVIALHEESVARFGGTAGVRDVGLVESALARPRHRLAFEPEVDRPQLAVAYGYGLARNHPFVDGNKRVAVIAVAVFLALNGRVFDPDEADEVRMVLGVAAGDIDEATFATWVAANTTERG